MIVNIAIALSFAAAPAVQTADAQPRQAPVVTVQDGGDAVSGMDLWFPFSLNEELHPNIDDSFFFHYLSALIPVGGHMTNLAALGAKDAMSDQILGDELQTVGLVQTLISMLIAPLIYIPLIGIIGYGIFFFWVRPVAVLNAYDRHLKRANVKPLAQGGAPDEQPMVFAY